MTFNPSSTIYLCNVPIDSTYQHQIYFKDREEQENYFASRMVKTYEEYLTVRETLPNGSFQSYVRVDANIDYLRSLPCNYMYYRNEHHGTRIFYAFITDFIYINEGMTKIVFETDVFQTWFFDVNILPSYVVREHSETDGIGDNLIPEKFNFQDYVQKEVSYSCTLSDYPLNEYVYIVGTSVLEGGETTVGDLYSGIYQGNSFYYFEKIANLNKFLLNITKDGEDAVLFISVIPKFSIAFSAYISAETGKPVEGLLSETDVPTDDLFTVQFNLSNLQSEDKSVLFDGYKPLNKKMYTNPFFNLCVSNHAGGEAIYNIEEFMHGDNYTHENKQLTFYVAGDLSATPSVTMYPMNYKGVFENIDCGISITGYPQCSFNIDSFKLWMAKNSGSLALDTIGNMGNIIAGVATMSTGAGAGIGAMQTMHGVTGILNTVNAVYKASKEPNKYASGSPKNNLLTSLGKNKFTFYFRSIRGEYAKTIDNFFTMYGYQTNELKQPNLSARPYYNYIQTVDINIVSAMTKDRENPLIKRMGAIPNDDMKRFKDIFNKGVTLWKPSATVGDYTVDNSPK